MKIHHTFTPPEQRLWHNSYSVELEPDEYFVAKDTSFVVVGYYMQDFRSRTNGFLFGKAPQALIVRKQTKTGMGTQMYTCPHDELPLVAWEQFLELLPYFKSYAIQEQALRQIAKMVAREYGSQPPEQALPFLSRNPYWRPNIRKPPRPRAPDEDEKMQAHFQNVLRHSVFV